MLPFELRSSAKIFNAVADAVEWRLKAIGERYVYHYLDDLTVLGAPGTDECAKAVNELQATCSKLGIPLATHKSEGAATSITFLGIVIDTVAEELRLPTEKLVRLRTQLVEWGDKKTCTLLGTGIHGSNGNGAPSRDLDIAVKELLPIILHGSPHLGAFMAQSNSTQLLRQRAVVSILRSRMCKQPVLMHMLRCLFFVEAFKLVATYVTSMDNNIADDLSRDNLRAFLLKVPTANRDPAWSQRHCSNIKIQTARSDLCDKCDQMLVSLRHTLSDKKRKEKNDQYNQHLIKAKAFRDSYNTNIEDAEKEWGRKRQKDRDQILGEKRVTLQADNCVGSQNKNTTMLWYLAWRVITGQHERIQLNFMLPGHTKFRPDSYFGLFKKHYCRQDHADDMDDLVDCVRQCGQNVTCVPQLCKDWQYYDWNAYLGQWFGRLFLNLGAVIHFSLTENIHNEDHAIRHQSHQGDHAEGWSYPQHHTRRLSKPNDTISDKAKWIVPSTVTVPHVTGSSQALHRRNSHKQSPVAGGGGQSDVTDTPFKAAAAQIMSGTKGLVHPTSGDVDACNAQGSLCIVSDSWAGAPHIRRCWCLARPIM
eukprot:Em0005g1688a